MGGWSRDGTGQRRLGGGGRTFPRHHWRILGLIAVLVVALALPFPGGAGQAEALGWRGRASSGASAPEAALPAGGPGAGQRLQEVAPPPAVQQLKGALAERQPQVRIVAPAAEAQLDAGPWTLRLQVEDWPLVDGGRLGLGPHLLVRVDDDEPMVLTVPETTMPELAPGSHRLTVVAARPWGEAVKSPGALAQIRVHRVAPLPLALPAPGTPQLLPMSPEGMVAAEPLLLDWLLIDAPLQHLREDDASWRLRVTVNGDSFLVDRQTPLWLRGWRPGRNALQLDLLDSRGEPLNPPYNSLVREVRIDPSLPRPAWLGSRLSAKDLAILLGEAPPEPEIQPVPDPEPEPVPEPLREPELEPSGDEPEPWSAEAEQPAAEQPAAEQPLPAAEELDASNENVPPSEKEESVMAPPQTPAAASEPPSPPAAPEPTPLRPAREEVDDDGTLKRDPTPSPLSGLRERLGR